MTPGHGLANGAGAAIASASGGCRPGARPHDALQSGWTHLAWLAATILALAVAPLAAAGEDDEAKDEKVRKPSLSLRASPPVAFSPARIVVTAELRGGTDAEMYCPEVEWEWGDDTRSEAVQNCEPFVEGESTLTRRWTQSHTYTRAGRYQAYLRLKRGDKVIVAGSVKVDVRPGAGDLSDFDR